jgi:uncharacterized protein YdaU (DUF1376 family)
MPMYWGDYLRDTRELTAEEHGAYLMLIAHYWNRGPLPDDQEALCRVALVNPKRWSRVWKTISRFFDLKPLLADQIVNGSEANAEQMLSKCWRHKRIDAEIEKAEIIKAKRQIAGMKGGLANRGQTNRERILRKANAKQTVDHPQSKKIDSFFTEPRARAEPPPEPANPPSQNLTVSPALEAVIRNKGWKESGLPRKEVRKHPSLGDGRSLDQIVRDVDQIERDKGWTAEEPPITSKLLA